MPKVSRIMVNAWNSIKQYFGEGLLTNEFTGPISTYRKVSFAIISSAKPSILMQPICHNQLETPLYSAILLDSNCSLRYINFTLLNARKIPGFMLDEPLAKVLLQRCLLHNIETGALGLSHTNIYWLLNTHPKFLQLNVDVNGRRYNLIDTLILERAEQDEVMQYLHQTSLVSDNRLRYLSTRSVEKYWDWIWQQVCTQPYHSINLQEIAHLLSLQPRLITKPVLFDNKELSLLEYLIIQKPIPWELIACAIQLGADYKQIKQVEYVAQNIGYECKISDNQLVKSYQSTVIYFLSRYLSNAENDSPDNNISGFKKVLDAICTLPHENKYILNDKFSLMSYMTDSDVISYLDTHEPKLMATAGKATNAEIAYIYHELKELDTFKELVNANKVDISNICGHLAQLGFEFRFFILFLHDPALSALLSDKEFIQLIAATQDMSPSWIPMLRDNFHGYFHNVPVSVSLKPKVFNIIENNYELFIVFYKSAATRVFSHFHNEYDAVWESWEEKGYNVQEDVWALNIHECYPYGYKPRLDISELNESYSLSSQLSSARQVLGVKEGCSKRDLLIAYRKQCLAYHPDRNKHPKASDEFNCVERAKEILMRNL